MSYNHDKYDRYETASVIDPSTKQTKFFYRAKQPRIVFDLDGTICFPNERGCNTLEKYGHAKPNKHVIGQMHLLKERDFYIIIETARRMLTYDGDVQQVKEDCEQITRQWLKMHNVPYNELKFGKSYSDTYYVDDKAMTVEDFLEWNCENKFKEIV